jgi:hypothetical protein
MQSKIDSFIENTTVEYISGPKGGAIRIHKRNGLVVAIITKWTMSDQLPKWVVTKFGPFVRWGGTTYKWAGWVAAGLK